MCDGMYMRSPDHAREVGLCVVHVVNACEVGPCMVRAVNLGGGDPALQVYQFTQLTWATDHIPHCGYGSLQRRRHVDSDKELVQGTCPVCCEHGCMTRTGMGDVQSRTSHR